MSWRGIVGRFVDVEAFGKHVAALEFTSWRPSFIVVHNTSAPDAKTYAGWRSNPEKHGNWTPERWAKNLESYYRGMGWQAGPHAFVCRDGILLFTPFTVPGTHTPSWNSRSLGIETVGEFERDAFDNGVRDNLIATLGILHAKLGLIPEDYKLGVRGLHFHKEDVATTHRGCPGKHIVKADLIADVHAYMQGQHPAEHVHVPEAVHTADAAALSYDERMSIYWLQASLNKMKLPLIPQLAVDGVSGAATRVVVRAFQKSAGLEVDGVAGPLTRVALKAAIAK